MSALSSVIINSTTKQTATVVWMHGLGDTGAGWSFLAEQLSGLFPYVKWILPNAPLVPVTLNGGMAMPAWFDIKSLSRKDASSEDSDGMLRTVATINQILRDEVDKGIPANRIVLGGFSQGSAMSLLTGLTSEYKLAAIIGCSGWLPMASRIQSMMSDANKKTPILMCHGDADPVVSFAYGQESAERLKQLKYDVEFKSYPNLPHSASPQELLDISSFLKKNLPPV
ncbi:Phospholipase/carboxylesterase/thioesterase [Phycomyces nitens]|nr:Phospholipase/carboxylesterase/thioesterase [Phycomyces nitens]